jgi:ubiquinone/menaquinone biosynthesis C-methylase UbiE
VYGNVLEIGPGGGNNLAFLSTSSPSRPSLRWIGIEPNPFFHDRLRARGARLGIDVDVRAAIAEALPVPDQSVDAVISTLALCSVRDPQAALREVRRVLRPGGRFVFVEHVAAPHGTGLRILQRALRPAWCAFSDGCHVDRDTGDLIEAAGFAAVDLRHFKLPVPVMGPHIAGVARA